MIFHDYAISAAGEIKNHHVRNLAKLPLDAVNFFADWIVAGESRVDSLDVPFMDLVLHWTAFGNSALASFSSDGQLITTSALAFSADPISLRTLEKRIESAAGELCPTIQIMERPLLVRVAWRTENKPALNVIAELEPCLAAAFFRTADAQARAERTSFQLDIPTGSEEVRRLLV